MKGLRKSVILAPPLHQTEYILNALHNFFWNYQNSSNLVILLLNTIPSYVEVPGIFDCWKDQLNCTCRTVLVYDPLGHLGENIDAFFVNRLRDNHHHFRTIWPMRRSTSKQPCYVHPAKPNRQPAVIRTLQRRRPSCRQSLQQYPREQVLLQFALKRGRRLGWEKNWLVSQWITRSTE